MFLLFWGTHSTSRWTMTKLALAQEKVGAGSDGTLGKQTNMREDSLGGPMQYYSLNGSLRSPTPAALRHVFGANHQCHLNLERS